MHSIKPFLWFNDNAEEAVNFYVSTIRNAKMGRIVRYGEGGPAKRGSAMTVTFELDGIEFVALNGGPQYTFTPAISFAIACETQAEIDDYWEKLTADGGKAVACGWLQDKFGLSWQVVPRNIEQLLRGRDAEGGRRAMEAMTQMQKLDIATLKTAGGLD